MKICEAWLREWVQTKLTSEALASQLTLAGLEVDSITPVAGKFSNVVVARVEQTKPHPQADKLTLCQVDCGGPNLLSIVCGASNVRSGLSVALAMEGAVLPNGMEIKETKLRGELSQGMLCSASELGLQDTSEGIIELPNDAPIGVDLREYMHLNGTILDIDLTPNRADCFSVLGIAREVAALNSLPLTDVKFETHLPQHQETISVILDEPSACPQYYGRIIRGINAQAITPMWLQERLRRSGIRPIHPVVDVTNYVMMALGQPMHAFDKTRLSGSIHVRFSALGEELELLDLQTVALKEHTLVIADEEKPLAIAGVMGGNASAIDETTIDIFLESAYFNPEKIAGVARSYGLCTESSQRYERGVDPLLQSRALAYATDLLIQIVGGEAGPIISATIKESMPVTTTIEFYPERVMKLTGVHVAVEDMQKMLENLGMAINAETIPWKVKAPSYRFDIRHDVDLVEEVIRLYGYDKIETGSLQSTLRSGNIHHQESLSQKVQTILCHRGFHEIITYSFVDPEIQAAIYETTEALTLLNPISPELSQMRKGLLPGLVAALVYNYNRQHELIKLFETGVIFDLSSGVLKEKACVAGLLAGKCSVLNWSEPTRSFDFFDLKGDVQAIFSALSIKPIRFLPETHPGLHPGQSAKILHEENVIGYIGALHPRLSEVLGINLDVFVFELMLDDAQQFTQKQRYQKISKFPSARRDLSFLIGHDTTAYDIECAVRQVVGNNWLKSFDVFDVYSGTSIPTDKKSLAIALILQDDNRTLIDEEVNQLMDKVVQKLSQEFQITLRD